MGQMVGHEVESFPQPASKELLRNVLHLSEPQQEGLLQVWKPPFGTISRSAQLRIERIGHVIDIAGGDAGLLQAKAYRALGKLMRIIEVRPLPCLMRLNRSSSTAATSLPSTSSAAANS